jgi:hypothetical protein
MSDACCQIKITANNQFAILGQRSNKIQNFVDRFFVRFGSMNAEYTERANLPVSRYLSTAMKHIKYSLKQDYFTAKLCA